MLLTRRQTLALFGRALLWLPVCLAAWYFASPAFSWIGATVARPAIHAAAGKVTAMKIDAAVVTYSVEIEEPYRWGRTPRRAAVDLEVKTRLYTFGLPLFLALALAARESRRSAAIAAGIAILAVVPAWGIAFDVLRQLGSAAEIAPFISWPSWARESIALGYQLGSLLLPTLIPVALWLASARGLWAESREAAETSSPGDPN
jgi:hypothetical protein